MRVKNILIMSEKINNGFYCYEVSFNLGKERYVCHFNSTAEITPEMNKLIAWSIADSAIIEKIKTIKIKKEGVFPTHIVISGDFGVLVVKD